MKFFFPDSQDQIDPGFDLITEEGSPHRLRQRDDHYPHEALERPPYDGMLVSKPIVDGTAQGAGRYTIPQRHRLYRTGIHEFLRLERPTGRLEAMGDCGAFTYVRDDVPPYTPDEVIDFYEECGFDLGFSVDHAILAYDEDADDALFDVDTLSPEWVSRQNLTLDLAGQFLTRHRERKCNFTPIGVAQGWSPDSYAHAVEELQKIGYNRIALGGMVPLKTHQILSCLTAIDGVRDPQTQLHLLGVTRTEQLPTFTGYGVTSFDSTSHFRRAFKDERNNYFTLDKVYTAIRVPQVDGNPRLKRQIKAGEIDQRLAIRLEQQCLDVLNRYDKGDATVDEALESLILYEDLHDGTRKKLHLYRETLEEQPWKNCGCEICATAGIHVILFRGSERNKRRGFHNLFVFKQILQNEIESAASNKDH